jgi:anti-sigma factor RsiW
MTPRISEHDEFLLSQLVDGDLPVDDAALLRQRLIAEPALRECYEEHCRLDQALVARRASQPVVDLDSFHAQVMQRLIGSVSEQDELLVGHLLDGELNVAERQAVEARLQAEPALRERHQALSRLNSALQDRRADQPEVNYGRFHKQVMKKIAAQAQPAHATLRFPVWMRWAAPIAVAAAVTLAVLLGPLGRSLQPGRNSLIGPVVQNVAPADSGDDGKHLVVTVAQAELSPDAAPIEVSIGRPEAAQDQPAIQVSVAKNTELAEATEKADAERAAQPQRKVFFVAASAAPAHSNSGEGGGDLF